MNNHLNQKNSEMHNNDMIRSLIMAKGNNQRQNAQLSPYSGSKNIKQNFYRLQDHINYNQQRLIATSRQPVRQPYHENLIKHSQNLRLISIQQINEKLSKIAHDVRKHDQKLALLSENNLVQKAINQLKKPNIFKGVADSANFTQNLQGQIYEHLFNFKVQLKTFKQQLQHFVRKKQFQNALTEKDKSFYSIIQEHNQIFLNSMKEPSNAYSINVTASKMHESDKLTVEINNLWDKFNKLSKQIQTKKIQKSQLKISTLKSIKPTLIAQYQQILKVKQKESIVLFNENVYHVDDEGYLLDYDKHYILKQNNERVKLETKHATILKSLDSFK